MRPNINVVNFIFILFLSIMIAGAYAQTAQEDADAKSAATDLSVHFDEDDEEESADDLPFEVHIEKEIMRELKHALKDKDWGEHMHDRDGSPVVRVLGMMIPIVAIIGAFGTPLLIIWIIMAYRYKRRQLEHESLARLVEKGVDIPSQFFDEGFQGSRSSLRKGVVLIGLGVGLAVFFLFADAVEAIGIGMIPLFIGAAYLLVWWLEGKRKFNAEQ